MRRRRLVAALASLAVIAAACATDDEPATPTTADPASTTLAPSSTSAPTTSEPPTTIPFVTGELIRLDLPLTTADVGDADLALVVAGDTRLGLDLFTTVAGDENLMLSPYSIGAALAMLYAGARGDTAAEMARVMHLSVDAETLHTARAVIDRRLSASSPSGAEDPRNPFAVRPANSAWGQGGYPFLDEYLAVLAANYGAGLRILDFAADPTGSTDTINDWVEEATEDRIVDLVPDGAVDTDTRLVLVNAIWFKANWAVQFDPSRTEPGTFTLLGGTDVTVPLMNGAQRTGYTENDLFTAVRLPYTGDASMVVALPRQGTPAELAASLETEDFAIRWGDFLVDITLPPFEFESDVALREALIELGMEAAFTDPSAPGGADLTGITRIRELSVTDALHKSFIALDEFGTEAAAATALIVGLTSLPEPASFTANRPFLFWIEHDTTGEILFLGQVTDPTA